MSKGEGESIASRLRAIIVARGVKQSWLAEEAEIPEETLSRILTETTKNPGVYTLLKIARALGETVGALLGERGYDFTQADRDLLQQFVTWASMRFDAPPLDVEKRDADHSTLLPQVTYHPSLPNSERKTDTDGRAVVGAVGAGHVKDSHAPRETRAARRTAHALSREHEESARASKKAKR